MSFGIEKRNQISAFVVRCLDSIMPLVSISEISSLYLASSAEQGGWWMDGWVRVLHPFNSISVILRRWKDEHERLCAMKRCLGSGRISPPAGFEPATLWSEVGSANRSATRMLQSGLSLTWSKTPDRFSCDVAQSYDNVWLLWNY